MKCLVCGFEDTKVLESRMSAEGRSVRRRRACQSCGYRFTTYEKEETFVFSIKKKDGRVEPYSRDKAFNAVQIACQKRNVTYEQIENLVNRLERVIQDEGERTVPSQRLGDIIMDGLAKLDKVAYVRFASVYKDFKDTEEFMREIQAVSSRPGAPDHPEYQN